MTKRELLLYFADDFGDWIDGDDFVDTYELYGDHLWVRFDSGSEFRITVEETHE